MRDFIEKNAISLVTIIVTLILMFGGFNFKLQELERRLAAFEDLKLEVKITELQKDISHIRYMMEKEVNGK